MPNISRNMRGGSRIDGVKTSYLTYIRNWHLLDCRVHNLGFRCVYFVNKTPDIDRRYLRDGSWNNYITDNFRTHCRYWSDPAGRCNYRGFRCVYPTGDRDTNG